MLNMIPTPYRLLAGAIVVSALCLASYLGGRSAGADSVQARWDRVKLAQEQEFRAREQEIHNTYQGALNESTKRQAALRADADAARAAAGGLRDELSTLRGSLPAASAAACRVTADAALAVFGDCADQYQRLAEAADGHAEDSRKLSEAWPK